MMHHQDRFAKFVAILGRGPGRSRALTREEAREAFGMVLRGEPDPHQVGAFLMLLRFRGEDADEITGMTEAARDTIGDSWRRERADLDWPSYGAGRTRGAPWFLLSALALARGGAAVLMHGSNEHSAGIPVEAALQALGMMPEGNGPEGERPVYRQPGFRYVPLAILSPDMDRLLRMRRLFGLRSPVNTVARLLDPGNAAAGVDGVFHPPYLTVHLGVAERLARPRLLILKGGGGEAERVPMKPGTAQLWDRDQGRSEIELGAESGLAPLTPTEDTPALLAAVWRGEAAPPTAVATVLATIGLGLRAMGQPDTRADAERVWYGRLPI